MSDKFRETSFYFNQDAGETASVSDDNEADGADDLETDRLNTPAPNESSAPGCSSNASLPSTPKFTSDRSSVVHRTNGSRDCAAGNSSRQTEIADSEKPPPLQSAVTEGTDRLLASSSSSGADNIVLTDVAGVSPREPWNTGEASSAVPMTVDVDAETARRKGTLTNGHIPYNFVTTARC